jgi:alcohol dehydrogenase
MKAAVLNMFGKALEVQELPDPVLGTGEVIVDVVAAGVTSYAGNVFNGSRGYLLELPVVPGPGGVGRVRATGPDATKLKPGDWVFVDSTIRSRDNMANPEQILLGWTYRTEAALPLHRYYHHGSFAEQMLVPTENATPLGPVDPAEAAQWTALGCWFPSAAF